VTRLIVVTGPGGAGTSTLAQATVAAAHDEGLTVELLDREPGEPGRGTQAVRVALGRVFAALGSEVLPWEGWSGLPGLAALDMLVAAHDRLGEVDAVVLDAGPLPAAREFVELPGILERLLDSALTPALAMWRSAIGEDGPFSALSDARRTAIRLDRMLRRAESTVRLVVPPGQGGVAVAERSVSLFAVLGVGVDAVIVNRYPRGKDDVPARVRKSSERAFAELGAAADGVEAWKSTSRIRATPKGRSVLGPFKEVPRLSEADLVVNATDEAFQLDIRLPQTAVQEARVGVTSDRLVVEFDGAHRWLELPPVLRRCRPVAGLRHAGGIVFEFRPDPDVWMSGGAT
jgi:arsenite-transporting ATPase